ncbi:MAG: energy-coupling factor transporter transmembrane protein EcfT [Propionicimonas sp.]|uniref:energy-coupling factor transporter transmembrane component T family protein n=1 Tax=Propionicimonas sp. TaxID=1955623 RepID=UPI002B20D402|nr:energy-coupling factor transporter transmembrane protein EcfT [Propionicimonas sp.]MEA4945349.1 energy-coupling factor transporter transmembrane protein EcfT [Propionicimonas sp.]MEA5116856.1 energy-coupling factor transporter transmembrane protein EcfT [Propionicimonas sp.]
MNLFGLYLPGDSLFHRLGAGPKYLILLALTLPAALLGDWRLGAGCLVIALGLLAGCRSGLVRAWRLPWLVWVIVAMLVGYHLAAGTPGRGANAAAVFLTAIYASRLLTITTPGGELIDALVGFLRPLKVLRISPERVGLAIAVMLRSIPVLLDTFSQVRQAARARGRERRWFSLVTPVVVRAVGHAQETGAALAARGLGEPEERS